MQILGITASNLDVDFACETLNKSFKEDVDPATVPGTQALSSLNKEMKYAL